MTKKALIIGPTYPAPYTLAATPNNITTWNSTLQARGYTMRTIVQGTKNRAAIQAAISAFVAGLQAGDAGALILLGHGGRVADVSGDEADGYDEAFAASDLQPIADDWLGQVLAGSLTSDIDVVADMCYAGSSTKASLQDAPQIDRAILPMEAIKFRPQKRGPSILPKSANAATHRLWAACGEAEQAYTCLSGGKWYSIFTLYLAWALRTYPTKTAQELISLVAGYVTAAVPSQHPYLESPNPEEVPF